MIMNKSLGFIVLTILLVSFYGECSSDQNVQFIKKPCFRTSSEEREIEPLIEPRFLENLDLYITPKVNDDTKTDQNVEKSVFADGDEEIKQKIENEVEDMGQKRLVRQVNSAYSPIYPTLSPPYRPVGGNYGNVPNNYPNNQNSYSNSGYIQPNSYQNNTGPNSAAFRPSYYPQGQNPLQNNTRFTSPGNYNQGSTYNQYPQYNQNSNQRYNTSVGQPYGNNANRPTFTPTPANQWSPGYTNNNTRYNPSAPNFHNPPNSYHNFNNSTPRNIINSLPSQTNKYPYNPSNPSSQSYPLNTNSQYNNYNRSNQWSSSNTQTPYNSPGNNYPSNLPSNGRSLNVSGQTYPGYNPSSYPTNNNPYNLQPSAPNYYPVGPNGNQNQYKKEPEHFFYAPGNRH